MDYPFAERLGELAREHDVALSVHAPLFGFMGHLEASGRKFTSAVGALDRSAGIAAASGAELVVFHPGFLLGREREDAIDAVVEQLGTLRERLEAKERAVPFGVEVMGRVRDLGSLDDVVEISRGTSWVRPVLDFAHMHATSDGAFVERRAVRGGARPRSTTCSSPARRSTSTSPTSRSRTATRRSTCPTARGRCGPSRCATRSARFERPATVISESPDEASSQAIRAVLDGAAGESSASAPRRPPRPRARPALAEERGRGARAARSRAP